MTTYGAYDAGLACKNPSCGSYGRPHPNCRCWGDMAEGGEVEPYCASDRPHLQDCEYFADGGEVVPQDDLPGAEPDGAEVPQDDLPEPPPLEEGVVPEADLPAAPEHGTTAGALGTAIDESIPIVGPLATKASRAVAAGLNQLTPDALLKPEWQGKSFSEVYDQLAKDSEQQAASHPIATTAGEALGSVAGFAAADKAAKAVAGLTNLGKIGSGILQGAISNGFITASDEAGQMMLGQNPEAPVSAILASAGLGGVLGGVGAGTASLATKKLQKLTEGKLGDRITSWLAGLGAGASPANKEMGALAKEMEAIPGFSKKSYEAGAKAFKSLVSKMVGPAAAGAFGYHEDGIEGALKYGGTAFGLGQFAKLAGKASTPVVLKILSNGTTLGMLDALSHADKVAKGISTVDKAVEGLFNASAKAGSFVAKDPRKIEDWINGGGIDEDIQQEIYDQNAPQGFAEGGEVRAPVRDPNGVETHFPEQNMVMQAAKARAANYLNSLRPAKHPAKLPFDDEPDNRQQKKAYKRAVGVAASPLRILDEIKKGTIEADDIKHLNAMFPEVTSLLQKKITERIVKAQLSGKKPPAKVRQGLSMLMGTALSGEFTPEAIQAAQAVFAPKGQSQQPQGAPPKGNKSKLSKSSQAYLTDDQARAARQQKP